MSAQQKCPNCGHINLPRAVYCFQCGRALQAPPADEAIQPGVSRRSQRIYEALRDEVPAFKASRRLPNTDTLRALGIQEPLTCLFCGALNRPDSDHCRACGTQLVVPDLESQLIIRASARSDPGQVRENNEDSIGLWALQGTLLALVADGMGGAVGGEEASLLTVEAVQADFVGEDRFGVEMLGLAEKQISEKLAAAIQSANQAVIDRVDENVALRGMGTTATLAFIRGRRTVIAHVGDSRAYLVDGEEGWINQITSDHSFVEALVTAGHISPEQAADHPMKNVLYRALGQTPDTTADLYDRVLKAGDRIVLCSDGLTRHVPPKEIAQVVRQERVPDKITHRLIHLANRRGGEDNISVVVIAVDNLDDVSRDAPEADTSAQSEDVILDTADDLLNGEPAPRRNAPKSDVEAEVALDFFRDDFLERMADTPTVETYNASDEVYQAFDDYPADPDWGR